MEAPARTKRSDTFFIPPGTAKRSGLTPLQTWGECCLLCSSSIPNQSFKSFERAPVQRCTLICILEVGINTVPQEEAQCTNVLYAVDRAVTLSVVCGCGRTVEDHVFP